MVLIEADKFYQILGREQNHVQTTTTAANQNPKLILESEAT